MGSRQAGGNQRAWLCRCMDYLLFSPHRRSTEAGRAVKSSGPHCAIVKDPLWPRGSWHCLPQDLSGTKLSDLGLARMGRRIGPICLAVDNVRINSCSAFELQCKCASASFCYTNLVCFSCFEYKPKPLERKDKDCPQEMLPVTFVAHWLISEKQTALWAAAAWMKPHSLQLCVPGLLDNVLTPAILHSLYLHSFCLLVQDTGCNVVRLEPSRTCGICTARTSLQAAQGWVPGVLNLTSLRHCWTWPMAK